MEQSKQVKYCFNLPNNAQMLCFNKLTGEYNAKKYFKKFSFCGSISLSIFLNLHILNMAKILYLHILNMAKILYPEWPKYSKCSLNDIKTINLLHFVLFNNYEFN